MSLTYRKNLRLVGRNEGQIKSYESCSDVRAWSHDAAVRDRYLREWMKVDMPICIIPASTLSSCLRIMTYKSRSRVIPRCHPNCKSRVVLESICTSCDSMKECLKQDEKLEKYFLQEEFETSHWPCDKCLGALKSIKMLWKIIIEKIFNIKVPNCEPYVPSSEPTNSVRALAKIWQGEILQQSLYVKNITSSPSLNVVKCGIPMRECPNSSRRALNSLRAGNGDDQKSISNSKIYIKPSGSNLLNKISCKKVSKCTCFKTKMVDVGCDTYSNDGKYKVNKAYKRNIQVLKNKYNNQNVEVENLRKENDQLKRELEKVYKVCSWKTPRFFPDCCMNPDRHGVDVVPKPFESNEENLPAKNIDSEMIITMKKCKNENFRHVSLLQVLHKTNDPITENKHECGPGCKKEDPIEILNKVQNTFGAIVRREMSIMNARTEKSKKTEVNASFHQMNPSKVAPSCSAPSSCMSSETDFISTKDFSDRNSVIITI